MNIFSGYCHYQNTSVGDKVVFYQARAHWFINYIENAKNLLESGKEYTVSKIVVASSSTAVKLVETGDADFSLSWFKPTVIKHNHENDTYPALTKFYKSPGSSTE